MQHWAQNTTNYNNVDCKSSIALAMHKGVKLVMLDVIIICKRTEEATHAKQILLKNSTQKNGHREQLLDNEELWRATGAMICEM